MNMQIDLEKGIANVGDVSRMKEVMARQKGMICVRSSVLTSSRMLFNVSIAVPLFL